MCRVDWTVAPAWANYSAMDEDGEVYWYQYEPEIDYESKMWKDVIDTCLVERASNDWEHSLEIRHVHNSDGIRIVRDKPTWARYKATNMDGSAYWFENKPYYTGMDWRSDVGRSTHICIDNWKELLEKV